MGKIHHALIICTSSPENRNEQSDLLGLSLMERLLLTLEKGGITHVSFVGKGPVPESKQTTLTVTTAAAMEQAAHQVLLVPSDLVTSSSVLQTLHDTTDDYPLRIIPSSDIRDVATNWESWLGKMRNIAEEESREFAIRVTDERSRELAERALLKSLQKDADGIISRNLNRKISLAISKRLARYPVKPNHVTAIVFSIGVCSGPLAYHGTYWSLAVAGFCYWFSAVLDGVDGELSRLKYLGTPLGAWLDTITDDVVCLSFVLGMYATLARGNNSEFWFWTGVVALAFYLLTLLPRYYTMLFRLGSGDYQKLAGESRPKQAGGLLDKATQMARDTIFRTDFLPFSAMITACFGVVEVFAIPFAVGSIASAADSLITLFKYRPRV
jgi:phosphatidylglycerophosphate synthase